MVLSLPRDTDAYGDTSQPSAAEPRGDGGKRLAVRNTERQRMRCHRIPTRCNLLPPATGNDTFTQRETGDRNITCGYDLFRVTGDGYGSRPFGSQPFSLQPPEPGCQLPMAERPAPELPMPVPVT